MFKLFSIVLMWISSWISLTAFAGQNVMQAQVVEIQLDSEANETTDKSLRVQDVESGKVASVQLRKIKGSSTYNGIFVIQFFSGDNTSRQLMFFEPNQKPFFAKVIAEASSQKVLLGKSEGSIVKMESKIEKASAKSPQKEVPVVKKVEPTKPAVTVAQIAVIEKQQRQKQAEEEKRILKLEEEENLRRLELIKQQEALSAAEKKRKIEQAKKTVAIADEKYRSGKFEEAVDLYNQAISLDPSDDSYIYRYGVALYKIKEYQKSLAVLSSADVDPDQSAEKDYYLGLIYIKLGDNEKALKKLKDVREEEDPQLSPTAAFLAANLLFKRQNFTEARENAEYVLDRSSDPKMDAAAEELIENITKLENYYASKKLRYAFSLSAGLQYDDNVLNVAVNNSSTDSKALRLNYAGSAKAIVWRNPKSDLGISGSFNDYYSVGTDLKASDTVQSADALELALNLPFHYEIEFGRFQTNLELSPYYKSIMLAVGDASRSEILNQTGFTMSGGMPIKSNLLLSAKLDAGTDKSKLSSSTGDDDQDATRWALTLTPTWLLDLKGEERLAFEFGYTDNKATGINYQYKKMQLAASWTRPGYWGAEWTYRFDYTNQNYPKATTTRTDTVYALSANLSKELKKDLSLTSGLTVTSAKSDSDSYNYNKWLLTSLFTWSHSILDK